MIKDRALVDMDETGDDVTDPHHVFRLHSTDKRQPAKIISRKNIYFKLPESKTKKKKLSTNKKCRVIVPRKMAKMAGVSHLAFLC